MQLVALVAVLGTAGFFLARTHTVTVVDDGAARQVRSYAWTVGGVLRQAGVRLGPHDTVSPHPDDMVGGRIVVGRGRPVTLTLDGRRSRRWVTARSVDGLLATLGLAHRPVRVSGPADGAIGRDGAAVEVRTRKRLTLVSDGHRTTVSTYAATVRDLIAERHLKLGTSDETEPAAGHTLAGVPTVSVFRVTRRTATETVTVKAPLKTEKRSDWMLDQQGVVDDGRNGERREKVEYIYRDGKKYQRKVLSSTTVVTAKPRVVAKGTTPYPADDTGLNWSALAQCESGGNPQRVSADGQFMGLYQFSADTWQRMGGIGLPSEATAREQTYRAIQLYKRSGKGQWPVCGAKL
ncbi:resuscitation-promoting factor [Actinocatenispora rupis]|uniref:Transglycosylase n=1 Tax=Actinocatenispora rupis TaxID=519421 RepID=A0A8J3NB64_9ACTN|nr:transglycosylase [Actinocatenispora rupis]